MFERKLTKAVAFQLLVEEVLAPALAIADLEDSCRKMARRIRVDIVHSQCVKLSTSYSNVPEHAIYTYLTEVAVMASVALEGSPYQLDAFRSNPIARQSRINIVWR